MEKPGDKIQFQATAPVDTSEQPRKCLEEIDEAVQVLRWMKMKIPETNLKPSDVKVQGVACASKRFTSLPFFQLMVSIGKNLRKCVQSKRIISFSIGYINVYHFLIPWLCEEGQLGKQISRPHGTKHLKILS